MGAPLGRSVPTVIVTIQVVLESPGGVQCSWVKRLQGEPKGGGPQPCTGPGPSPTARCDMTTPDTTAKTARAPGRFRLPDIPQREPDEVSQFDHLFKHGNSHHLAVHLGNPETTLVEADRWIVPDHSFDKRRARYPDLLVAFGVDPALYAENNGYIVSEQRKPPDFVLEVASESTASADLNEKRDYYASIGVREYWRFDETGRHHRAKLAGDRLVDGEYVPIDIEELDGGSLEGYSAALNLNLRWEPSGRSPYREGPERGLSRGLLGWYDPATGRPIATLEEERARADAAEARVRELEDLLHRENP